MTNGDGLYDTNSILPGSYTLEFSKQGFDTFKRGPVPLQVGIVTVDAQLKVGTATEVVQVSSDQPLLKTEDAQVSTTLSTAQLDNLPNSNPSNGYTELLKLLPGATGVTAGQMNGGNNNPNSDPQFAQAINGTMPYFSSYLVDGGSIWLPHSANTDQGISESVSELNVIAVDAPSQYGGGGSVFNVILKSGTESISRLRLRLHPERRLQCEILLQQWRQSEAALQLLRRGDRRADPEEQNVLLLQLSRVEKPEQLIQHGYGANCSHVGRLFRS